MSSNQTRHIRLTSHPDGMAHRWPLRWAAATPAGRGPVIGSTTRLADRNVIGTHGGSYSVYRALAVSAGTLSPLQRPDLANTHPVAEIGPHPQWSEPGKIVSLDPWGHLAQQVFDGAIAEGIDIRPSIAVTQARLNMAELNSLMAQGSLKPDGQVLHPNGDVSVTKIAVDPVWWLPGIAERFATPEHSLRRTLFEQTGGMYPELVTRPDLEVFLPPIGGISVYVFGAVADLARPRVRLTCRVHDECNGSDVFGSDICTCRPYLIHGIEESVRAAQSGGDQAATYFERTECVAGVQDARFQQLMPDVLHWLGITRIHRLVSMSNMKYEAMVGQGIEVGERVPIPEERVPMDANVEMEAKKAAGYFSEAVPDPDLLRDTIGRPLDRM